jgi:L-threonylcarbamoyladenylate synthase
VVIPMLNAGPRVTAALRADEAVVLPLPSPLPYGVFGTSPAIANRAKGRPENQPTGIVVADVGGFAPHLAVSAETVPLVEWLCVTAQLNVFVPLAADAPAWMLQDRALTHEAVGIMGSWLPGLRDVLTDFGHLFVSSANKTKQAVAVTAGEADESFGGRLLVVDGDADRDAGRPHGSATMVRVSADGQLTLARHGINDKSFGGDDDAYLAELRRQYEEGRRGSLSGSR